MYVSRFMYDGTFLNGTDAILLYFKLSWDMMWILFRDIKQKKKKAMKYSDKRS
jgi:hypothetical protein